MDASLRARGGGAGWRPRGKVKAQAGDCGGGEGSSGGDFSGE